MKEEKEEKALPVSEEKKQYEEVKEQDSENLTGDVRTGGGTTGGGSEPNK